VSLLGAILCHFFGRICATFGSDFVSSFWTKFSPLLEGKNPPKIDEISSGNEGKKCSRIVTHIPVSNGTITNGNVCHDSGALFALISLLNFARFGWIFSTQFGWNCVTFGATFVSSFWTKVCHFWERFCVTFLDESVSLLGAILCHFFGRICVTFGSDFVSLFWTNLCHFWGRFCVTFLEEILQPPGG